MRFTMFSLFMITLIIACFLPAILEYHRTPVQKTGLVVDKEIKIPIHRPHRRVWYKFTVELHDPWTQVYVMVNEHDYEKYNLGDSFVVKF